MKLTVREVRILKSTDKWTLYKVLCEQPIGDLGTDKPEDNRSFTTFDSKYRELGEFEVEVVKRSKDGYVNWAEATETTRKEADEQRVLDGVKEIYKLVKEMHTKVMRDDFLS